MAKGSTIIHGINELKVKETDRIKSMNDNLSRIGMKIEEDNNSIIIHGQKGSFKSSSFESFGDHRIAMSLAIASLLADGESVINNVDCVNTSYPNFINDLTKIIS